MDRRRDRSKDRQTDIKTNRQTEGQAHVLTDRQMNGQAESLTDGKTGRRGINRHKDEQTGRRTPLDLFY